jgi:hypothetical protein
MGRGSRQAGIVHLSRPHRDEADELALELDQLLGSSLGFEVASYGRLDESEDGHERGTPFILVRAACVDDAIGAEEMLGPIARVPLETWHGTWRSRRISGRYVLERKIYPTDELLADLAAL